MGSPFVFFHSLQLQIQAGWTDYNITLSCSHLSLDDSSMWTCLKWVVLRHFGINGQTLWSRMNHYVYVCTRVCVCGVGWKCIRGWCQADLRMKPNLEMRRSCRKCWLERTQSAPLIQLISCNSFYCSETLALAFSQLNSLSWIKSKQMSSHQLVLYSINPQHFITCLHSGD